MKLALLFPLFLVGCGQPLGNETDEPGWEAKQLIATSTIQCADGNQVRVAIWGFGGNSATSAAWPVLNPDGKPKRCELRQKAAPQPIEAAPE